MRPGDYDPAEDEEGEEDIVSNTAPFPKAHGGSNGIA